MEFKIENNLLKEKLELMNGAIPQKSSQVSLVNLNLKIANRKIVMIGSNLNMSIKQVIVNEDLIEIVEEGQVLINYAMLKSIISKIQGDITHFKVDDDKLIIKNKKSRYTLNLQDYNTYPQISFVPYENKIELDKNTLSEIINQVSYAVSTNEKRPILTGTNIKIKNKQLIANATNSYRLSMYKYKVDNENELNVIIPKETLNYINKIIQKTKQDKITICYDDKNLLFQFETMLFKTTLLEGTYPDLTRIIATSNFNQDIVVNKQELLQALDRVLILVKIDRDTNLSTIKLEMKENEKEISIISKNDELGNAKETIEIENKVKKDFSISFSANYLIECLKVLNEEFVKISFDSNLRPFKVINYNDEMEEKLHIISPVNTGKQ